MSTRKVSVVAGFALAVLLPATVMAEAYDASTGYVTLLGSDGKVDGNQTYSLTPNYQYHRWSDGQPLHTGTNYYIGVGLTARADGASDADVAPAIVLAGTIDPQGGWGRTYTFQDLRMLSGSVLNHNQINQKKGAITVLSEDSANPAKFYYARNDTSYTFRLGATVVGGEQSQVAYAGNRGASLEFLSGTDWSGFNGTLTVYDNMGVKLAANVPFTTPAAVRMGKNCHLNITSAGCPCTVGELVFTENAGITNKSSALSVSGLFDTGTNAQWNCASAVSAGNLVLNKGLSFFCDVATIPVLTITRKLEIGEGVSFTYRSGSVYNPPIGKDPLKMLAMKISPEAVAAGLPDFSKIKLTLGLIYSDWAGGQPENHCYFAVEDDPEVAGGKCVYATHEPIIVHTGSAETSEAAATALDPDKDQSGVWTDKVFTHKGGDYYLNAKDSIFFVQADADHPNRVTTFPGDMLICNDQTSLYVTSPSAYVENLVFFGRSTIYPRASNIHWGGNLQICKYSDANPAALQVLGWSTFYLDSKLSGMGALNCQSYYPTGNGGATVYLTADNTDWNGALVSSWIKTTTSPDADTKLHTRVVVGDGKSLGGDSGAFRHDAIQLANYTEVRFTNTTAMAVANRGIVVTDNGELRVDAGQAAAVDSPVTLNGILRKTGAGTLALAGGVRYGLNNDLADTTAPTEGRNVIRIDEGDLKIAAAEGVAFSLAAGGRFLVDAESGPLVDTTATVPFVSDDGLVRIAPDAATTAKPEHELVLPLLRVSTAAADAIDAAKMLQVKSAWRGVKCTSVVRTDSEGVATYTGTFEPVGLLLIFR